MNYFREYLNPFHANAPFLYTLKTLVNQKFSKFFKVFGETLAWNEVKPLPELKGSKKLSHVSRFCRDFHGTTKNKDTFIAFKNFKWPWSSCFCTTHCRLLFALFCDDHAYQLRLTEERNEFFLAILVERRLCHL